MGKSDPVRPATPQKEAKPANRLAIINDVVAFASIFLAYQFMSITWRTNLPKKLLRLTLNSSNDIAICFLLYSALLLSTAVLPRLLKITNKEGPEGQKDLIIPATLEQTANSSMLFVVFAVSLTLLFGTKMGLKELCHIAFWLLWSQVSRIICGAAGKWSFFQSAALFGRTIRVLIILALLMAVTKKDFFLLL